MPVKYVTGAVLSLGAISCGQAKTKLITGSPAVIVGKNDQRKFKKEPPSSPLTKIKFAVGRMTGNCTAFHLGNGIVATAGHCVPKTEAKTEHQSCPELEILWGDDGSLHNEIVKSRCLEVLSRKKDEISDYTFMIVSPVPHQFLSLASAEIALPAEGLVMGYPEGGELAISDQCHVEKGNMPGEDVVHDCDTLPGNSGSPILNPETLEVFAIHDGGYDQKNYGTLLANTPVESLLDGSAVRQFMEDHADYESLRFENLGNSQKNVYAALLGVQGSKVSFVLNYNTEKDYDLVRITDLNGYTRVFSGDDTIKLEHVQTPVIIDFISDYSGPSQFIDVSKIEYSGI